jgi:hypothetical protein
MHKGVDAAYLLNQAAKCRRLAGAINSPEAAAALLKLDEEYEAKGADLIGPEMDGMPHPKLTSRDPTGSSGPR